MEKNCLRIQVLILYLLILVKSKKKNYYYTDSYQQLHFIFLLYFFMLPAFSFLPYCTANSSEWFLGFRCIDIDYLKWGHSHCNGNVLSFTSRLMPFQTMLMLIDSPTVFLIYPSLFRVSSWKTSESCKSECFWSSWKPKHLAARYWLLRLQLQL